MRLWSVGKGEFEGSMQTIGYAKLSHFAVAVAVAVILAQPYSAWAQLHPLSPMGEKGGHETVAEGITSGLRESAHLEGATLSPTQLADLIKERDRLFMLAAMSYTYAGRDETPPPGYDISAVIAWEADDPNHTPEFVIDRNRNYEKQGEVFHAEANAIRAAYEKKRNFSIPPTASGDERRVSYVGDFKNATLYTTLEPCPMCATTITMAKIPRATFCMDDPGLRDRKTHDTVINVPTRFYGRSLRENRSTLPICNYANTAMWRTVEETKPSAFEITTYLKLNVGTIFKPAWDELACGKVQYLQNDKLLSALRRATGAISCER